ncbi:MAG: hypothetical protein ABW073_10025 [Acidimicrobiia bacterium]
MLLPSDADAALTLGVVERAFASVGGLDELQSAIIGGIASGLYGLDAAALAPATEADTSGASIDVLRQAARLMAVLEFVEHPLRPDVADAVNRFAREHGVGHGLLEDARELARDHFALVYYDLQRHGWYRAETIRESLRGRFRELVRSKLSYFGVVTDTKIATKWRGLRDCEPGTWGRAVADFYARHSFPFPGERNGIYELGARHDWVHVLADYETTPEGEIDVFSFIAASMRDDRGVILLAFTLGLFQNGSIHHVSGKRIGNIRTDTLSDPLAVDRMVDALSRGRDCTVDVMGELDEFAHQHDDLADVRRFFNVRPPA